jgi:flagellar basal-body rod modification protein FlgD
MSQVSQSTASTFTANEAASRAGDPNQGYNDLDLDAFLKLLIAEMQNQDPLSPMENSEMVAQIGQIRSIGATDQLTTTLGGLSSSQEMVTASSMIGRKVNGVSDKGENITGLVEKITVDVDSKNGDRSIKVHVDGKTMNLRNIREVTTG